MPKYIPDFLFIITEGALLLFSLYAESAEKIFSTRSAAVENIFPYQFFLLIIYITFKMISNSKSSEMALNEIKLVTGEATDSIHRFINTQSEVEALSPENFYSEFEKNVRQAQRFVGITHLDLTPPEHLTGTSGKFYYDRLQQLITEQSRVTFHRVERATPDKLQWIKKLVETYTGVKNFSLSCYISEDTSQNLPAISVQVIDDEKVFLVAVGRQTVNHGAPRDFYIRDSKIHELWQSYYDSILFGGPQSLKILEMGRLNRNNYEKALIHMGEVEL